MNGLVAGRELVQAGALEEAIVTWKEALRIAYETQHHSLAFVLTINLGDAMMSKHEDELDREILTTVIEYYDYALSLLNTCGLGDHKALMLYPVLDRTVRYIQKQRRRAVRMEQKCVATKAAPNNFMTHDCGPSVVCTTCHLPGSIVIDPADDCPYCQACFDAYYSFVPDENSECERDNSNSKKTYDLCWLKACGENSRICLDTIDPLQLARIKERMQLDLPKQNGQDEPNPIMEQHLVKTEQKGEEEILDNSSILTIDVESSSLQDSLQLSLCDIKTDASVLTKTEAINSKQPKSIPIFKEELPAEEPNKLTYTVSYLRSFQHHPSCQTCPVVLLRDVRVADTNQNQPRRTTPKSGHTESLVQTTGSLAVPSLEQCHAGNNDPPVHTQESMMLWSQQLLEPNTTDCSQL